MKYVLLVVAMLLAAIAGLVNAGLWGSLLFGGILSLAHLGWKKLNKAPVSAGKLLILFFLLSGTGYLLMFSLGLLHAGEKVTRRVALIKKELKAKNYNPIWITISQKRNRYYNDLLANSAENSYHIRGMAIDLFVFDIDGDLKFDDRDINILEAAVKEVEKNNPELKGGLIDYHSPKKSVWTRHMIHLDTRGQSLRLRL